MLILNTPAHNPTGFALSEADWDAVLAIACKEAAQGKRDVDLMTVSPGDDKGGRPRKGEETGTTVVPVSEGMSPMKAKNLRAILRAPEQVQDLYREGLIRQTDAAKLGPRSPTPEQAAAIVQARERIEAIDRDIPAREFRRRAGEVVREALGIRERTPLDHLRDWWAKADDEERAAFLEEISDQWLAAKRS